MSPAPQVFHQLDMQVTSLSAVLNCTTRGPSLSQMTFEITITGAAGNARAGEGHPSLGRYLRLISQAGRALSPACQRTERRQPMLVMRSATLAAAGTCRRWNIAVQSSKDDAQAAQFRCCCGPDT